MSTLPQALTILHDDADVVAIAKPPGLVSVPAAGEPSSALRLVGTQLGLPYKGSADPRVRPVHRLDKDTSGVLLFVKHRAAQQTVSHQFQNNQIAKQYLALVVGTPEQESGTIDAPLERDPRDVIRMRVHRQGKRAVTDWKLLERFRDFALLQVFPRTGKTHQIRVHLAHIGHPLAVDPLYKPRVRPADSHRQRPDRVEPREPGLYLSSVKRGYRGKSSEEERPLIGRLTLHAEAISLVHPNGTPLAVQCELPRDFRAALNMLSKYGR